MANTKPKTVRRLFLTLYYPPPAPGSKEENGTRNAATDPALMAGWWKPPVKPLWGKLEEASLHKARFGMYLVLSPASSLYSFFPLHTQGLVHFRLAWSWWRRLYKAGSFVVDGSGFSPAVVG